MSKFYGIPFIIVMLAGQFACTPTADFSKDPKGRLTEYIAKSFSVKGISQKDELTEFLTGDVRGRLESWSEDQFRDAFVNTKREFVKLVFLEVKAISDSEMQITYELTYLDPGQNKDPKAQPAKITNKKLCQMNRINGKWLISDVKNIKELIEYQNELSLP